MDMIVLHMNARVRTMLSTVMIMQILADNGVSLFLELYSISCLCVGIEIPT